MMTNPRHEIEKEYRVKVNGFLRKEESLKLARGVTIDGYKTKRSIVKDVSYNNKNETIKCRIIIKRVRFGIVTIDNMRKGEVRRLRPHEIKKLKFLSNK